MGPQYRAVRTLRVLFWKIWQETSVERRSFTGVVTSHFSGGAEELSITQSMEPQQH